MIRNALIVSCLILLSSSGFSQEREYYKSLEGIYTYGSYEPIYLEDDDGEVDSSFSYCSLGQLELYYARDTMWFNLEVCNATYHVGQYSGWLDFQNESEAQVRFGNEEGDTCYLDFKINYPDISIEELNCWHYHGARAYFSGDFSYARSHTLSNLRESRQIKRLVQDFFNDFNNKNTDKLSTYFLKGAEGKLETVVNTKEGIKVHEVTVQKLGQSLAGLKVKYKEEISNIRVMVDGYMATVWMDYQFVLNESISHCGTNQFDMVLDQGRWKIRQLSDNRFGTGCSENSLNWEEESTQTREILKSQIHRTMDRWHKAAAEADEDVFFPIMAEDCIYLGTDSSERWTKEEFTEFAMPYFERDKAWAFTRKWRHVYFNHDYSIAWFEEALDTWMGECRGSGVLRRAEKGWQLAHYNLAVTIANGKIEKFIELVGAKGK